MDQKKIGIFISELRKKKKLTQNELGEKLGINGKSVSKWERGITMPDLSNLSSLADILEVSVDELLCGEKDKELSKKNKVNVDVISFYVNQKKKRIIYVFSIIILIIFIVFSNYIYWQDYHKWGVDSIVFENDSFYIEGYLISSRKKNIYVINNFACLSNDIGTIDEPRVKKIIISLYNGNEKIVSKTITFDEDQLLHHSLENFSLIYEDKYIDDESKLIINVSYVNKENKTKEFDVKIK